MRSTSIGIAAILALAACGTSEPGEALQPEYRFVTIGSDLLDVVRDMSVGAKHGAAYHVLDADPAHGVALIDLQAGYLDMLATQLHARTGRCGGFELHDSLVDAEIALHHVDDASQRPALDYTIDHPDEVATVLPALDAERIRATIAELSGMKSRYYRSESGAAASTWLRDRWRSLATRKRVTVELVETGYPQKSVVMTIPGTTRASEVIVIGAHLDSIAITGDPRVAPGADDDASGIATLTEVARVLLAADYRPSRTIQLMAYAAEEVGLRGSLQIARDYQKRKINVVGAMQLDMTNYQGSDKDIWIIDDFTSALQNQFLEQLLDRYVPASYGHDKCGYACSDHAAWHRIGVPASMPFEARFKDANQNIHSQRDTLETSHNNAAHAVKFAQLAAAYAIELGKGELSANKLLAAELRSRPGASDTESHRWRDTFAALGAMLLVVGFSMLRSMIRRID